MKKSIQLILLLIILGMFNTMNLYAQTQTTKLITGTVIDSSGEAIIGASIIVQGTTTGTVTDFDGNFELTAPVGSTIQVSYLGYTTYSETITETKNIYPITLREDTQALDEVVVVGYGTQRRSELTGSITSVRADEIKDFAPKSVAEALGGMAAGVMVTKGSGAPGEAADIIIRGAASINGMKPLYIVDGVRQGTGFEFNMRDVESIEILKDAGSSAIYGAQAAGGVILITTKRGARAGKTTVSANARYGFRNITTDIKLLNRDDFIRAKSYTGADILAFEGVEDASTLPDVNWMDVMYQTGIEQEYNLSVSGSSEKTNFFLSAGFYSEKGVFIDTKAERFSFRTNIDHRFNDYISIGESLYGNLRKNNPANNYSVYHHALPFRTVPTMDPLDPERPNGLAQTPSYLNGPNLYGLEQIYHYTDNNYNLNALAYLDVNFFKGLNLRVNLSGNFYGFSNNAFQEAFNFRSVFEDEWMEAWAGTSQELIFNAALTYENTFGDHSLKAMIGTEAIKYDGYRTQVRAIDFPVRIPESINLSSNPAKEASDGLWQGRSQSFFGRINYSYLGKYLLTANIRRDGSDKFGPQNRWGTFPSINGAWRISEENFVKDNIDWLNNAKLRASWGILGNDGIGQFLYEEFYVGDHIIYSYGGGEQVQGWANFKVPNEAIKWEEVHQTDIGIDLGFFNNRLTFVYDYYNRQTRDMLYKRLVPLSSGIGWYTDENTTIPINIGKVQNIGHEFTINWSDRRNDFTYSLGANFSFNRNKVLNIGEEGAAPIMYGINRTENGNAMGLLYGFKALGIFQTQDQVDRYNQMAQAQGRNYYWKENTSVGDIIFDDYNPATGEHQGYVDDNCMTYIGNPWPKMTFGINMNFEYKGFDLSLLFQGATGFDIYNRVKMYTQNFADDGNTTKDIFKNSFFGDNGLTDMPRSGYFDERNNWIADPSQNFGTVSSFWVEKGNYMKLKNLVLGYTLPKNISRKAFLEQARVYFSAQNLFTITGYSGIDPEIAGTTADGAQSVMERGVDNHNRYLPSRLFSFGIDLTF